MSAEVCTYVSTMFEPGQNPDNLLYDGNVLQRLCAVRSTLGVAACEGCELFDLATAVRVEDEKLCADRNLLAVVAENGLEAEDVLMVGVTGDKIGFYDNRDKEKDVATHRFGWGVTAGYNAYFARASQLKAMGARLADCSFVQVSADLPDGDTVFGLIHMTRGNIQGDSALSYGPNGDQSYVTASVRAMAEHYGVSLDDVQLNQIAKIDQLDYAFKPSVEKDGTELTAEQNMDRLFAGWFDQGLLHNVTNPAWRRGGPIDPADRWIADYQEMTEHVILNCGVPTENINVADTINPGDATSGHASNAAAKDMNRPADQRRSDGRDAYLVLAV